MGFGFESTAEQVIEGVDLTGKTAVVTGANSGIGFETARALACAGAEVIVTARDAAKTADTVARLREAAPGAKVDGVELELGSLASVRAAADRILARAPQLHLLINNAGVMNTPFGRTPDGFETQFGVDHLGHFVLTGRLAPSLLAGAPARVVCVSSAAHMMAGVQWDDINWERTPYDKFRAYAQAKTANILFALELDRRLAARGVRAYSLHPGGISTGLGRYMTPDDRAAMGEAFRTNAVGDPMVRTAQYKTVPQGAATSVWAAVSPDLEGQGGVYLHDCQVAPPATTGQAGVMAHATDPEKARRLWTISEEMVGERFPLD
jgi:NAD(P)-dependent dehydrogenase (short-subunit alcohol dehydrogenase family)